ncbi:CLUMA_CG019106, isoform A [Clunio marinus]|uniref:CLUMA_CG019106, isoform A n=1 Tax=Clunio marinus TaxID=568069 RepID=A0A1J1J5J8_9DIPT|nr:CLUMA_CG019106, isoform A [Clunio marinus]
MKSFIFILFVLLHIFNELEAQNCSRGRIPGIINVCRQTGRRNCVGVSSGNTCVNLNGGPFVSGFTSGNFQCTIHSDRGCRGRSERVTRIGSNRFSITPRSFRCPCV